MAPFDTPFMRQIPDTLCDRFIVEILFPKQPLRAMALEIISVHKIEVSEGVSIFYKEKKNQYTSPYRIKDGQISYKLSFVREGP